MHGPQERERERERERRERRERERERETSLPNNVLIALVFLSHGTGSMVENLIDADSVDKLYDLMEQVSHSRLCGNRFFGVL